MKKVSLTEVVLIVFTVSIVVILVLVCVWDNKEASLRKEAFDNSLGVVVEKIDGLGETFDRLIVEIPYEGVFRPLTVEKQYILIGDVFDAIDLGSLYDGSGALGYVSERQSVFDISEYYVFY